MYQSKEEKILKSKRGITLISLVVTIIILLILAGVSIGMLTGENGILKKAGEASEKTKVAAEEEQRQLTIAEATMNFENTEYTDKNGTKVIIPAGFAVSQVEGENTVEDGVVIIDSDGNEFVWIPCGEWREEEQNYNSLIFKGAKEYVEENSWNNYEYNGYTADKEWKNTDSNNNYNTGDDGTIDNVAMRSIKKYGGFYVARYEAGVPKNANFYVASNESSNNVEYAKEEEKTDASKLAEIRNKSEINGQKLKPVSKKGNQVWNFIDQGTAKTVSENMYADNSTVDSYLIDSNAWNYICRDIFQDKVGINIKNSSDYGNYCNNTKTNYESIRGLFAKHSYIEGWIYATKYEYGNIPSNYYPANEKNGESNRLELATGASEDFKAYNIYDMAGNLQEWTEEVAYYNNGLRRCYSWWSLRCIRLKLSSDFAEKVVFYLHIVM